MQEPLLALLAELASSGELSTLQRAKGFQRVADQLGDLALDMPAAPAAFRSFAADAVARGILDEADLDRLEASAGTSANGAAAADADGADDDHHHPHARGVATFKRDAATTLSEYFASADASEVARRLEARCGLRPSHSSPCRIESRTADPRSPLIYGAPTGCFPRCMR